MAHVSIVVVSHSAKLGQGLIELLKQLAGGSSIHIVSASGLGDELGTDATLVLRTLEECPADSDIVVLFDLGSALLSCEMAVEMLPEGCRQRVHIVDAPLVEGAIAAAVEASIGGTVDQIIRRAVEAKQLAKVNH